ncbi:hypothetical protein ACQ143_10180 [Microbacterium sp. MC2]
MGAIFDPLLRDARIVSWRDSESQRAAGFGTVAPDWAFALGPRTSTWLPAHSRGLLAVTLRFDRPWPCDAWLRTVRSIAAETRTEIVTLAQVARDSPRAVGLASALGGRYLVARSTRHDDLDRHVRSVYSRSIAVVSDRAHALVIGATEGAYPIGSASDPQKIKRILDAAGLGALTGDHHGLADRVTNLQTERGDLAVLVDAARRSVGSLEERIAEMVAPV